VQGQSGAAFDMLIALVPLILMAGAASWRLAGFSRTTMSKTRATLRTERVLRAWFAETRSNAIRVVVLVHSDDPELKRRLTPQVEAATHRISAMQKEVEGLIGSARARALFEEVGVRRTRYLALSKTVFEMKRAGQTEEALSVLNASMLPAVETYIRSIKGLVDHYTVEVERDAASDTVAARSMRNRLIRVCAAGILIGILFSWWITASTKEPARTGGTVGRWVTGGEVTAAGESGARKLASASARGGEFVGLSQHRGRENRLVGFSSSATPDHWEFGGGAGEGRTQTFGRWVGG
jgi:hypothetical protein